MALSTQKPQIYAAYLEKLKPLVESEHATIAAMRPAAELRPQFNQFLAASTHQLGLFESALSKLRGRDATGLRDLLRAARYKRTVMLPNALESFQPRTARFEDGALEVCFETTASH